MMGMYRKYHNFIERALFPLILLLYPFLAVNQGIDVADSTYSLTNFQYFDSMNGTWMVATFLSNAVGWLLMHLPFGGTLLGMKCYTTLMQSALALLVYFGLRKRIPAPLLFLGEFLALGLCWCPSTILYNYLTYLLMTGGILLIYMGLSGTEMTGQASEGAAVEDISENTDRIPAGCRERGIERDVSGKKRRLCFAAAGVCLGVNIAVRMPNVVQAAFILAVWYGIMLISKRRDREDAERREGDTTAAVGDRRAERTSAGKRPLPWRELLAVTGWCLLGYAIGFGVPFAAVCIKYGVTSYPDMVYTMFAMTEQAADYKPTSMLTGMFRDYGTGLCWLAFAGLCAAAAGFAFWVRERLYGIRESVGRQDVGRENGRVQSGGRTGDFENGWNAYTITGVIIKAGYLLLLLVLLRFYWGRGMFHFRYYEYGNGSIYYPAVLLLLVTIAAAVLCLIGKQVRLEQKILAALVLLQIFLTPLGSNNDLYPIVNNLFVAAPFLLWVMWDRSAGRRTDAETVVLMAGRRRGEEERHVIDMYAGIERKQNGSAYDFVWRAPVAFLIAFVTVQSIGSHTNFVFQDGIYGEPRERQIKLPEKAAGVYTTLENGALLEELCAFIEEEGLTDREMITYGELPGLHYLLDMPPALSTGWADLDSYRMIEYTRDLAALEAEMQAGKEAPVIIVSSAVAAYWSDDGEAIGWFGVDVEEMAEDEKQRILSEWVRDYGYTERFGNARYVVYVK